MKLVNLEEVQKILEARKNTKYVWSSLVLVLEKEINSLPTHDPEQALSRISSKQINPIIWKEYYFSNNKIDWIKAKLEWISYDWTYHTQTMQWNYIRKITQ